MPYARPAMPPPNLHRRRRLAEAATHVLARGGSRGLTHRAVDAFADVPPGTTSRYFRNRDALFVAVTEYAISTHLDDVGAAPPGPGALTREQLVELLVQTARAAAGEQRFRHVAVAELYLESNRRPALREAMVAAARQHIATVRALFAAAGVPLDELGARRFVAFIDGMLFSAVAGCHGTGPDLVETLTRQQLEVVLATDGAGSTSRLNGRPAQPAAVR
jgi:AcrR family transcriptional regulator